MNLPDANAAVIVPAAQAGYFGAADRPRFGWLHRPASATCDLALVIVPPFGFEAVCALRSLRHLAQFAAAAGVLAVRFDLDGCGDSAGDDLDPDRLEQWLLSIDDACALARGAGARRIVLAGVRLGASLATLAALRRDDVAAVIAIAAVPKGKALLREGRVLQMALALTPPPSPAIDDVQELVGFALTGETRRSIEAIDLLALPRAPAPRMLLIDRDDLAPNDAWASHLLAAGASVEQQRLPGYVEMMLDPHRTVIPVAIIEAAIAFAVARATEPAFGDAAPRTLTLRSRAEMVADGATIREDAVRLDDFQWGIATRPASPDKRAVLLLNAGAVGRIGPNRLYVALARTLAARGHLVLRVDLSGIGDSATRARAIENTVYGSHVIDDIASSVAWLRQHGTGPIAAVGLCSGGYHALKAALAGLAIGSVVAINPLTFHYAPGMALDFAAFRVAADAARYQRALSSGASWRKLVRGQVDLTRVARIVWLRAIGKIARPLKELQRHLHLPLTNDLGSELAKLARRDVNVRFVFAASDPGRGLLFEEGGSVVPRLLASGMLGVTMIDGPDHTFTPRWSHAVLLDALVTAIDAG
ncbi:MAG: hypothetical protein ABIR62_12840 [Dokdonella sp.]|uniref:hypothetical protein n=1 Tax=Dokdonella sp. TaxID=2291710 RepID=UPI0032640148